MKKVLGTVLGLGLLCSSAVAAEETQTQEGLKVEESKKSSIGWFVGAGVGMVNTSALNVVKTSHYNGNASMPMFGVSLSGGVILPHNENVNHLISADLVYQTLAGYDKRRYNSSPHSTSMGSYSNNLSSNGYGIEATINYNLSYDIYKSDTYTFTMLGGVGLGGAYVEGTIEEKIGNEWVNVGGSFNSRGSFIINANLGVRNILFKNHAIDLTLKSRVLEVYSEDMSTGEDINGNPTSKKITKADTNAGFTLMLSYTFLKF